MYSSDSLARRRLMRNSVYSKFVYNVVDVGCRRNELCETVWHRVCVVVDVSSLHTRAGVRLVRGVTDPPRTCNAVSPQHKYMVKMYVRAIQFKFDITTTQNGQHITITRL